MKSDSINELSAALTKAQAMIVGAVKDSKNPFFKSDYADLASVWDAIREPLTKNNLSVAQTTDLKDGHPVLVTTLCHSSGQFIQGIMPLFLKDQSPQAMGSAITYARRYALAAIMGVAQIDDDGESAQGRKHHHQGSQKARALKESMPPPPIGPAPDADPFIGEDDVGKKIIQVGKKFKGLTFNEVGSAKIESFVNWLEGEASQSGKPLSGAMRAFLDDAYLFLGQGEGA